jgi:uncharacterized protein
MNSRATMFVAPSLSAIAVVPAVAQNPSTATPAGIVSTTNEPVAPGKLQPTWKSRIRAGLTACALAALCVPGAGHAVPVAPDTAARSFPLDSVQLLDGPFKQAVAANRDYLLALDPDRLLAPFLREAGLEPRKPSYKNWESGGLDGHTAGHYLSALALMIGSGNDTPQGEFRRRLDYMLAELARVQKANGNGYIGGVPGSRALWAAVAAGDVDVMKTKWVPWYNLHKTYAGLRDACLFAHEAAVKEILVRFGDWCVQVISGLSDEQMQRMIATEYGGMNEVLADLYAIAGDVKYLRAAERFNQRSLLDPLAAGQDQLTGKHANTQIPKVVGFERIATLTGDEKLDAASRFFWETVTKNRSVAFGGNSVREHFNDPKDFSSMIEDRQGPETCNTYNMLRLTGQLFATQPRAAYADYYERALFNHLLSAINIKHPGYVYFTPIRPGHYRVYSEPETCFWCCVGTGMENPGKYGEFIYQRARDGGLYVNLFIPSELKIAEGATLRQETKFPYEPSTRLVLHLPRPETFTLRLRHPAWVEAGQFKIKVNGRPAATDTTPSSYAELRREWSDGDVIEVALPMRTTVERLPDGSDWVAIMHGPIVLAAPAGTENQTGLRADGSRMGHVAHGPLVPLDKAASLLTTAAELPAHVVPDPAAGPLHFRLKDVVTPAAPDGVPLAPFFALHDARYQMYWELTTEAALAARRERLAAAEQALAAREAATLDRVQPGEQQPEVEHDFKGEATKTGVANGRRWRDGKWFQYALDPRGEKAVELEITCWGGDDGRAFDILVNDTLLATVELKRERPGQFVEKRFPIPAPLLTAAAGKPLTVKFVAKAFVAGGIFDVRLVKPGAPLSNH